jgi:hypothetical protein
VCVCVGVLCGDAHGSTLAEPACVDDEEFSRGRGRVRDRLRRRLARCSRSLCPSSHPTCTRSWTNTNEAPNLGQVAGAMQTRRRMHSGWLGWVAVLGVHGGLPLGPRERALAPVVIGGTRDHVLVACRSVCVCACEHTCRVAHGLRETRTLSSCMASLKGLVYTILWIVIQSRRVSCFPQGETQSIHTPRDVGSMQSSTEQRFG